ncbi:MAG: hypothetical protein ACFFCS_19180, partial [Candidatus Hodarchaeota archaeon]
MNEKESADTELEDEFEEDQEEKAKKPRPVLVILQNDGGLVVDNDLIEELHERSYFGRINDATGALFLFPEELIILSERNRLLAIKDAELDAAKNLLPGIYSAWDEQGYVAFQDDARFFKNEYLFNHFNDNLPDFWEKYVVYRDLKTRGYIVRRGIQDVSHFRVYKKGDQKDRGSAKFIYFSVFEGKPISLFKLHEISEYAMNNR